MTQRLNISGKVAGSYILYGPHLDYLHTSVMEHIRALMCLGDDNGPCANCRKIASGLSTDIISIKPQDKPSIGIETVRTLIKSLNLSVAKPGQLRSVLIEQADCLTTEAQNGLLKLLEEPPAHTIFFLTTTQPDGLLPTVRSRCQAIFLSSPQPNSLANDALATTAMQILEAKPFARMVRARKTVEAKTNLFELGTQLQRQVTSQAISPAMHQHLRHQTQALEQFRRQLAAGVNQRAALEQLVLEL